MFSEKNFDYEDYILTVLDVTQTLFQSFNNSEIFALLSFCQPKDVLYESVSLGSFPILKDLFLQNKDIPISIKHRVGTYLFNIHLHEFMHYQNKFDHKFMEKNFPEYVNSLKKDKGKLYFQFFVQQFILEKIPTYHLLLSEMGFPHIKINQNEIKFIT